MSLKTCVAKLKFSIISTKMQYFQNASFYQSNPLKLRFHQMEYSNHTSNECKMKLELQNIRPLTHTPPTIPKLIDTECYVDDYSTYDIKCYLPFNNSLIFKKIACNGKAGTISLQCPYHKQISNCNAISNFTDTVNSGCEFESYTSSNTICSCDFNRFSTSKRRRLLPAAEAFTSIEKDSLLYVSMEAGTVIDTVVTFKKFINKPIFIKGTISGATIGAFFFFLFAMLFWFRQNSFDKKLEKADKAPRIHLINQEVHQNDDGHIEIQMIENSLPYIFREMTKPFAKRMLHELFHHHKWFSFLHTDVHTSKIREFKLISFALHIASFLVINALLYQLIDPDDGYCESLLLKHQCLVEHTSFVYNYKQSKCYWEGSSQNGLCHFRQPSANGHINLYVNFYSGFLSYPLSSFLDWVVWKYLASPVKTTRVVPDIITGKITTSLKEDLDYFVTEMYHCRQTLSVDDRKEFDREWGLDKDGLFTIKTPTDFSIRRVLYRNRLFENILTHDKVDGRMRIAADMKLVRNAIGSELAILYQDVWLKRQGNRIFYLFMRDMIPKNAVKFLELKTFRDNHEYEPQCKDVKFKAWVFVTSVFAVYLAYLVQFSLLQPVQRQIAWLITFGIWIAFDLLIVSSLITYITHIFLPSMIMGDVRKVKRSILKLIPVFYDMLQFNERLVNGDKIELHYNRVDPFEIDFDHFNTAKHTFISYRLARLFEDLEESKIVLLFKSIKPHSVIRASHNPSAAFNPTNHHKHIDILPSAITNGLRELVSIHIVLQNIWIPIFAYLLMLASIFLFAYLIMKMNPGLVVFPVVIAIIVYAFFAYTSKPQAVAQFGKLRNIIKQKREEYLKRRERYQMKMKNKSLYPAALKASQISKAKMIHKEMEVMTKQRVKNSWTIDKSDNESKEDYIDKIKQEIEQFVSSKNNKIKPSDTNETSDIQHSSINIDSTSNFKAKWDSDDDDDDHYIDNDDKGKQNNDIENLKQDRISKASIVKVTVTNNNSKSKTNNKSGFLSILGDDNDDNDDY